MDNNKKPDNMLVWSILTTVVCCLPLGIMAILESNKVDRLWAEGDAYGAENAAQKAKSYCLFALGLGVLFYIICFVIGLAGEML